MPKHNITQERKSMDDLIKETNCKAAWQETCEQVERINRMVKSLNKSASDVYDLQNLKVFNQIKSELNKVSISLAHANLVVGAIATGLSKKRL